MQKGRSSSQWSIGILEICVFLCALQAVCAQTPGPQSPGDLDPVGAKPGIGLLAEAGSASGAKSAPVAVSQTPKPSFRDIKDRILSTTDTVPLARIDATEVTNRTLRYWLGVAKPTIHQHLAPAAIMALPGKDLAGAIKSIGFYEMARADSLKKEESVSTQALRALKNQTHDILRRRFFEKEVDEKQKPMSEEEARRNYQENLTQYTQPFRFTARAIFLSTYKPYMLKKKDLEGGNPLLAIARDQIGSSTAINRILDPVTSSPIFSPIDPKAIDYMVNRPRGVPPPPSLDELMFVPHPRPRVGQVVMIPMGDVAREAVRQRMLGIAEQLSSGTDFVELAKAHSEEPVQRRGQLFGPLPSPGRPFLPSVIDAAFKTAAGEITPILETPHGFLMLRIESKTEDFVQPFEAVRAEVIDKELTERRKKARAELERAVFRDPILKIEDAFMENNALPDRVIARVGDFEYTMGAYRRDTLRPHGDLPPTREARLALLEGKAIILREEIIAAKARAMGVNREPDVAARLDAVDMIYRGRAYLEWYADHSYRPKEAKLREFHEQERALFRKPGEYRLIELVLRLEEERAKDPKEIEAVMNYLRDHKARRARSYRQFARMARDEPGWPPEKSQRGQSVRVKEDYRGEEFAKELIKMEEDRVSGPFHQGNDVFLVWLRDRTEPKQPSFEDVRSDVERAYRNYRRAELLTAAEAEIRSRHSLEYLFEFDEQQGEGE